MKYFAFIIVAAVFFAGCTQGAAGEGAVKSGNQSGKTELANPASVYCDEHGGSLRIVKDASGGEVGMCTLANGTVCEEWAYFRGECPAPAG